jgi:hypothetical protein
MTSDLFGHTMRAASIGGLPLFYVSGLNDRHISHFAYDNPILVGQPVVSFSVGLLALLHASVLWQYGAHGVSTGLFASICAVVFQFLVGVQLLSMSYWKKSDPDREVRAERGHMLRKVKFKLSDWASSPCSMQCTEGPQAGVRFGQPANPRLGVSQQRSW